MLLIDRNTPPVTRLNHVRTCKLLISLLVLSAACMGQQNATLTGTVSDTSEAAIGGAFVRLKNTQTGEAFSSLTDATGSYTIPLVKPGQYELTVEAQSFKLYRQTGISLETGATARVDPQLEIGAVAESVTVELMRRF